jgi:predicted Abi (CAAX) family protease
MRVIYIFLIFLCGAAEAVLMLMLIYPGPKAPDFLWTTIASGMVMIFFLLYLLLERMGET